MAKYGAPVNIEAFKTFTDVSPSDSTALVFSGLYIGVSGDVVITDDQGTDHTFKNMQQGLIYPIEGTKIKATGTTATNMIACNF